MGCGQTGDDVFDITCSRRFVLKSPIISAQAIVSIRLHIIMGVFYAHVT